MLYASQLLFSQEEQTPTHSIKAQVSENMFHLRRVVSDHLKVKEVLYHHADRGNTYQKA